MRYQKDCVDAYEAFIEARDLIESVGILVLSGEAGEGHLIIGTDQPVPQNILDELSMTEVA